MKTTIEDYVEYQVQNMYMREKFVSKTNIIDPYEFAKTLEEDEFGFTFFKKEVVYVGEERLESEPKNYSPTYYLGTELTKEDVEKRGDLGYTLSNMQGNGVDRVVETIHGRVYFLGKKDIVIDKKNL